METAKKRLEKLKESVEILKDILDTENYGMCIVDRDGYIVQWNYERFFDIPKEQVIGRPVTEVLENTRLHIVAKTGKKELYQLQEIRGANVIANRIPIIYQGEIIGAAGTIIFKDTKEIGDLFDKMERVENNILAYRSELAKMYRAKYTFDDIKTTNNNMLQLKKLAEVVAKTDVTILIQGESGTGKELFAHAIHQASLVCNEPLVSINCASIPRELLESELFGYEGGAFTGSKKEGRVGKFELAGKGTLFLDEIGTMPLDMQAKLLRVLESHEFERVGGNKKIKFTARVIAATNANLVEEVRNGTFRKDLYYRLNVVCLDIPPLRERLDDIECLCDAILENRRKKYDLGNIHLAKDTIDVLKHHNWPGNIRELRNVIERGLILCEGTEIKPVHISGDVRHNEEIPSEQPIYDSYFKNEVASFEKKLIQQALKNAGGNRAKAAKALGIHRSVLYKKMSDYSIE